MVEKAHPKLTREGANLVFNTKISLADALADCTVEVPTLDGRVLSINCPEVIAPSYEKSIPGEGMPLSKKPGEKGDLVIRFVIIFPEFLADEKKAQLRRILMS